MVDRLVGSWSLTMFQGVLHFEAGYRSTLEDEDFRSIEINALRPAYMFTRMERRK